MGDQALKPVPKEALESIQQSDWTQDWSGNYTLLVATLDTEPGAEAYFALFEKTFGKSISQVLITFNDNIATAWLPTQEYEEVSTYLAHKACDESFLTSWVQNYDSIHARLLSLLELPEAEFMQRFDEYRSLYPTYAPYVIGAKQAYDFLPLGKDEVGEALTAIRTKTEKFYSKSHAMFGALCSTIAEKHTYPVEVVRAMTIDEFAAYCRSGTIPTLETLLPRLEIGGLLMVPGGLQTLSKTDVATIRATWNKDAPQGDIRGTVAYRGVVSGRCRVINDFKGATLDEGDILVTGMTDPNFVPLMKKAGAIVTDAGGLLSHAAIVARELKKPCIVGTKFATQILKDGDRVEVDAEAGVIKLLK